MSVGKKPRHLTPIDDPRRVGDQYTFVALDPESKIVPARAAGGIYRLTTPCVYAILAIDQSGYQ
jgi:hypothetical protein